MAYYIKQFDRRPLFVVALKDNFGEVGEAAVNLTTASTALFNMRLTASPFTVQVNRGAAVITNAAGGEVTYSWGTSDTSINGNYQGEVEIVWNDGKAETFPNNGYFEIVITDDIA